MIIMCMFIIYNAQTKATRKSLNMHLEMWGEMCIDVWLWICLMGCLVVTFFEWSQWWKHRHYIHVRHKQITFISKEKKSKDNTRRTSQGFVLNMHLGVKWNIAWHRCRGLTFRWWKMIKLSSYHGRDTLMSYTQSP